MKNKEVKRHLRLLRKIKKDTRKGSKERRELNKQIRELKKENIVLVTPEKEAIIKKILEVRPYYKVVGLNLEQYTIEQLEKHYKNIRIKHDKNEM